MLKVALLLSLIIFVCVQYIYNELNAQILLDSISRDQRATPLHLAACSGNLVMVQRLLRNGAKILDKNIDGLTPIHLAALSSHSEVVRVLVDGLDVNRKHELSVKYHPLHSAAESGCLKSCKIIVEYLKVKVLCEIRN